MASSPSNSKPANSEGIRSTPSAGVDHIGADIIPQRRQAPTASEAVPSTQDKMLWRREGEASDARLNPPPGTKDS